MFQVQVPLAPVVLRRHLNDLHQCLLRLHKVQIIKSVDIWSYMMALTVTTIEESAVATGSMLGTFEGVINGNDVEFRVTMNSSSSATIKTKIDTLSS